MAGLSTHRRGGSGSASVSSIVAAGVVLALTAGSADAAPLAPPAGPTSAHSNVLFLFADEMDGRILDPASPQVKVPLPNLHRLAASGALFTVAYNQSPQCVPSRSAMMVGLRTDQIEVWDNYQGIAATNADPGTPDPSCVKNLAKGANQTQQWAHEQCVAIATRQKAPPTFIDRLGTAGYNVSLFGKMHVGGGLERFQGSIQEMPFSFTGSSREWTRGLGPAVNLKGLGAERPQGGSDNSARKWVVPDNITRPASQNDYDAIGSCVSLLRGGLFGSSSAEQPHPVHPASGWSGGAAFTYPTNKTYMDAVASLDVRVPEQVPWGKLHPNDWAQVMIKGGTWYDSVPPEHIIHFRRVYFSMCFESDSLLGQVIDALDASGHREGAYVMMISDHGEDNIEHRQTGKNNMYDSASRVAMILSGPGITPGQTINTLTSLNDVFPTVLNMAGLSLPPNLAGRSLIPLVNGVGDPARKDFITAQYHSVDSVTGFFMIRQTNLKLITFGANRFESDFPPQLFDLEKDPWELHDIAASQPAEVERLGGLLLGEIGNTTEIDTKCKQVQRSLFKQAWYEPAVQQHGPAGCQQLMTGIFGGEFNASDAVKVAQWLGSPCPFAAAVPDPSCTHGVKDATGKVCCAKQCGVCAHPAAACGARPGGSADCCPSRIAALNVSCTTHPSPCVISGVRKQELEEEEHRETRTEV